MYRCSSRHILVHVTIMITFINALSPAAIKSFSTKIFVHVQPQPCTCISRTQPIAIARAYEEKERTEDKWSSSSSKGMGWDGIAREMDGAQQE